MIFLRLYEYSVRCYNVRIIRIFERKVWFLYSMNMESVEQVISVQSMTCLQMEIFIAVLFPLVTASIWKFRRKAEWMPLITGVCAYFGFAIVGRNIMNVIFVSANASWSQTLSDFPWVYLLYVVLQAVILEEIARYICFRFVLNDSLKKDVPISFGIGFGCLECIYVLGLSVLDYFVLATQINTLGVEKMMEMAGLENPEVFNAVIEVIQSIGAMDVALTFCERVLYMVLHVSLSILIFAAVHYKEKFRLLPIAVVLRVGVEAGVFIFSGTMGIAMNRIASDVVLMVFTALTAYLAYMCYNQLPQQQILIKKA